VFQTYNKYRSGSSSTTSGSALPSTFTSNHDIARTINRIHYSATDNNGISAQGNVTSSDYARYNKAANLVKIAELMMPGCTFIYYGDELGMTGNFPSGTTSKTSYADLWYRQPMKWYQDGTAGDGHYDHLLCRHRIWGQSEMGRHQRLESRRRGGSPGRLELQPTMRPSRSLRL
jgi:glycosidase